MNVRLTHAVAALATLCLGASLAHASPTIWSIDTANSTMSWTLSDIFITDTTIIGIPFHLSLRNEVTNAPWGTPTGTGAPGNFTHLSGVIGTNYIDQGPNRSISFLGGNQSNIPATLGGAYAPKSTDWNPNLYGAGIGGFAALHFQGANLGGEGYIVEAGQAIAFSSIQNLLFDITSGVLPVDNAGNFTPTALMGPRQEDFLLQSFDQGTIQDGYLTGWNVSASGPLGPFGQQGNNTTANATIQDLGGLLRKLTINYSFSNHLFLGSDVDFLGVMNGTIVATALVPEPSTLMLCGLGIAALVGFAWRARKRKA